MDTITWEDTNTAYVACAQEGTIRKKEPYLVGSSTTSATARKQSIIVLAPPRLARTRFAPHTIADGPGVTTQLFVPTELSLTGAWLLRWGNVKQPFAA